MRDYNSSARELYRPVGGRSVRTSDPMPAECPGAGR